METVRDWVSDHPATDQLTAAALTGLYLVLHFTGVGHPTVPPATAASYDLVLGPTAAGLAGLVFAAVAIIRSLDPGRRLQRLQELHGRRVTRSMMSVIKALAATAGVFFVCALLEQPSGHPLIARSAGVYAFMLGGCRLARMVWIFGLLLGVNDADRRDTTRRNAPQPKVEIAAAHRRQQPRSTTP